MLGHRYELVFLYVWCVVKKTQSTTGIQLYTWRSGTIYVVSRMIIWGSTCQYIWLATTTQGQCQNNWTVYVRVVWHHNMPYVFTHEFYAYCNIYTHAPTCTHTHARTHTHTHTQCQGLMQDIFFASHTFLVDTWMLSHIHTSQLRNLKCVLWPEINYKTNMWQPFTLMNL